MICHLTLDADPFDDPSNIFFDQLAVALRALHGDQLVLAYDVCDNCMLNYVDICLGNLVIVCDKCCTSVGKNKSKHNRSSQFDGKSR